MPFAGFSEPKRNYSELPHALIAALPVFSSLAELKVVIYILRHTWGYHEYEEPKQMTLDEFENGRKYRAGKRKGERIDNGVGMSKPSIVDGLKRAIEDGFIVTESDTKDRSRIKKFYSLRMLNFFTSELPSDVKEFNIRGKDSLQRSSIKETGTRNNEEQTTIPAASLPLTANDDDPLVSYRDETDDLDLLTEAKWMVDVERQLKESGKEKRESSAKEKDSPSHVAPQNPNATPDERSETPNVTAKRESGLSCPSGYDLRWTHNPQGESRGYVRIDWAHYVPQGKSKALCGKLPTRSVARTEASEWTVCDACERAYQGLPPREYPGIEDMANALAVTPKTMRPTQPHMLPIESFVTACGKSMIPTGFAYGPLARLSKAYFKASVTPEAMACAGAVYRAWYEGLEVKPVLTWTVADVTIATRLALGICAKGLGAADVTAFMRTTYESRDAKGEQWWKGKHIKLQYVADHLSAPSDKPVAPTKRAHDPACEWCGGTGTASYAENDEGLSVQLKRGQSWMNVPDAARIAYATCECERAL